MRPLPPIPKHSLKIGVAQITSIDNVEANLLSAWSALEHLRSEECDLIVLPENSLYMRIATEKATGVVFNLREDFWKKFQAFADREKCSLLFGSLPLRKSARKKPTNATVLVSPKQKPKVVYEKIHLFDVDVDGAPPSRESESYSFGDRPKIIKIKDWKIGLSICYDVRFAELYSYYAKRNVHLILVPAAFLVPTGQAHWHTLLKARAVESQSYVAAPAQWGGHESASGARRETFGHSLVVDPWGEILLDLGGHKANVAAVTLRPERLVQVRRQIPMTHHRRLKG